MSKQYIHCGSQHFDIHQFVPIRNRETAFVKPEGGLWGSPVDSDNSWIDFCSWDEHFRMNIYKSFKFELSDNANVLFIDSVKTLDKLYSKGFEMPDHRKYPFMDDMYFLDFEKILKNGCDAIEVAINPETYNALYGWDVDSILVMNPRCIIEVDSD